MKIELMSPAGDITSFIYAVKNGADSVYLGLKKYNARKPASNFSIYELKKTIQYAHSLNKKIYLTLNIDLKDNELENVSQIVEFCTIIKIDAVIIKDPGLLYIMQKFYKNKINIHLSTQNAITSSFDISFAKSQGAKRVILARELEFNEIKLCCLVKDIECEIFTEGSMCFSVSGRCLMSSWVGGRSGNRGVCTAPCRVLWEQSKNKDNYFSMKDLSLLNHIDELKKINVCALKIEGRLKNPLWIGKITSIYRKAIDGNYNKDFIDSLYNELKKYSAREIESGHFVSHKNLVSKNEEWQKYEKTNSKQIKDNLLNEQNNIKINVLSEYLEIKIKLHEIEKEFKIDLPGKSKKAKKISFYKIKDIFADNKICDKKFDINISGDEIFLPSSYLQKVFKEIENVINFILKEEEKLPELNNEIKNFIKPINQNKKRDKIFGDLPDKILIYPNQMDFINKNNFPIKSIVISLASNFDINEAKELEKKYELILSIPEVLFENDAVKINKKVNDLKNAGFNNFEANSFCGIEILQNISCNKYLGPGLTVMNHIASEYFYNIGFNSVYASIEAELSMYKALSSFSTGKLEALVFGKIPLFISRVESEYFSNNKSFKDKYIEIECKKINNINYFVSKTPLSFIGNKIKENKIYFDALVLDLRYFYNGKEILDNIFNDKIEKMQVSTFNLFKKLV